ncbi:restriction endonuclease subunit S [Novosphingobium meiothermophilum]|uniref:restriction endonuclease subunit S n=1 Tax=Novosphingobium meiothermophilum TaxID=2202251 RepID=UPI000D6E9351|nr:restriction endonuclease subunit S [Novosphingobium meiothermophilum]
MSEWTIHAIKDIALGIYDGPHATPPLSDDGPVFLGIGNVTDDGHLDLSSVRHIAEKDFGKWTKRVTPRAGDIVFTYEATLNRYAIIPEGFHGCLGRRMALIRPDTDKVDTRFLFYSFFGKEWRETIEANRQSGATVDRIPLIRFPNFPIVLPPLETQRRIASILGAYDDLIEVNRRRIAVLEEMARGLFEEWFVRFRFPGHEAVPILDTPNGPLPEGWTWGAFRDLAREVRQTVSPDDVPPNTPYVGLEHMPRRSFTLDQHGQAEDVSSLKSRFQRGDVLFGKIRPYFHKVVWAGFDGISSTDAIIWRPVAGLTAQALATASSDAFVAYSVQTSNGTKMPRANTRVLADYRCALAPSDISSRFEDTVGPMVELCATLQAGSHRLAKSRDLLLPRLISGQLSVAKAERQLEEAA